MKRILFFASLMLILLAGCKKNQSTDPTTSTEQKDEVVNIKIHFCTSADLMKYATEKVFFTAKGEQEQELTLGEPIQLTATNDKTFHDAVAAYSDLNDSLFYFYEVSLKVKKGEQQIRFEYTAKPDSLPEKVTLAFGYTPGKCDDNVIFLNQSVIINKNLKSGKFSEYLEKRSASETININ